MAQITVSFRSQTSGEVSELIQEEGLGCLSSQNLLSFLIGTLLHYREEGVELSPSVLFCENADSLLDSLPGVVRYQVGAAPLSAESGKRVLKECASLAVSGWHIWIERSDATTIRYGVFSYLALPTTPELTQIIAIIANDFAVILKRVSKTTVEIFGARGNSRSIVFSTVREESLSVSQINAFCSDCCSAISGDDSAEFLSYFQRILNRSISSSHGAITVCCERPEISGDGMQDGILLDPVLDFLTAFRDYRSIGSADAILKLQALESLLASFINSDGIVAFTTSGSAFAYRVFYRGDAGDPAASGDGGARRRAFEGVRTLMPAHVRSALFRSQDGLTIYASSEDA